MKLNIDLSVVQMFRDKFGPGWTIEDDRRFWARIQGRQGLCGLKKDAKALESICKELSNNSIDQEFMKHRLQLIGYLCQFKQIRVYSANHFHKIPPFFC